MKQALADDIRRRFHASQGYVEAKGAGSEKLSAGIGLIARGAGHASGFDGIRRQEPSPLLRAAVNKTPRCPGQSHTLVGQMRMQDHRPPNELRDDNAAEPQERRSRRFKKSLVKSTEQLKSLLRNQSNLPANTCLTSAQYRVGDACK